MTTDYNRLTDVTTFSRSSTAQHFVGRKWVTYPVNSPRIDNDGLLIEPNRQNLVENNTMQGAVVGVLGAGGQLPTGWFMNAATPGLTIEVVAIGNHFGLPTIDIRYSGMPESANPDIFVMPLPGHLATVDDTITISSFIQLVSGSMTGFGAFHGLRTFGFNNAGGFISGTSAQFGATIPVDSSFQRFVKTGNLVGENVARTRMTVLGCQINSPVDATFRISTPQLELSTFVTSPIPTTNSVLSRTNEGIFSLANDGPRAFVAELNIIEPQAGAPGRHFIHYSNQSYDNYIAVVYSSTGSLNLRRRGGADEISTTNDILTPNGKQIIAGIFHPDHCQLYVHGVGESNLSSAPDDYPESIDTLGFSGRGWALSNVTQSRQLRFVESLVSNFDSTADAYQWAKDIAEEWA